MTIITHCADVECVLVLIVEAYCKSSVPSLSTLIFQDQKLSKSITHRLQLRSVCDRKSVSCQLSVVVGEW